MKWGQAFFKDLARAQISGEVVGMLKILFNRETYEILGIHCFGDRASDNYSYRSSHHESKRGRKYY